MRNPAALASLAAATVLCTAPAALAATYQVGADKPYQTIHELEGSLLPGDVVEVDGDAVYAGDIHIRAASSGTPDQKVTLRGIAINGQRPVIEGGVEFGIVLNASHFVFEGFEVRGAPNFCVAHKADDLTISDVIVHDCPNHGILSTDFESGSLTIQFSEVHHCGFEEYEHQLYIATDESMYPGSVFRLEHSYIHDGNGGNNVKSRAERNEIYCNWIESPLYHVLDLIDPDGQDPGLAREDSDVVGNVLIQYGQFYIARLGGDHDGMGTSGRYRFAFNTLISNANAGSYFYLMNPIESVALHNNAFIASHNGGGPPALVLDLDEAQWTNGVQIAGVNNWIGPGVDASPLSGSIDGELAFADEIGLNYVPIDGSALIDASAPDQGPSGFEVPGGWAVPTCVPALRRKNSELASLGRPATGAPDVGVYELGTTFEPGAGGGPPGGGGSTSSSSGQGGGDLADDGDFDGGEDGCSCSAPRSSRPIPVALPVIAALLLASRRRVGLLAPERR